MIILNDDSTRDISIMTQEYAEHYGMSICDSGAKLANLLGFSTQVPAKYSFLIDGDSRDVIFYQYVNEWNGEEFVQTDERIGTLVRLEKVEVPFVKYTPAVVNHIIQALHWVGKDSIDLKTRKTIKFLMIEYHVDSKKLREVPEWIARLFLKNEDYQ
jgi:hypothetical protein